MIKNKIYLWFRSKENLYYLFVFTIGFIIQIINYPKIYGVDAFDLIWMAQAINEGALFSSNTWLIHPLSYLGYYPFSHRAIGVPLILALITLIIKPLSLGITEAIFIFNMILQILLFKSVHTMGKKLFKEEKYRLIFIISIFISPFVLRETIMTVSSRIFITLIMFTILNQIFDYINGNGHITKKNIFIIIASIISGIFLHRLWLVTLMPVGILIFIKILSKKKKYWYYFAIILIMAMGLSFFIGIYGFTDKYLVRIESLLPSFMAVKSVDGRVLLITYYLGSGLGIISIFFPIGLIFILKTTFMEIKENFNSENKNPEHLVNIEKFVFLLVFMIPFLLLIKFITYSIVVFLPILVIISIYGLKYFENTLYYQIKHNNRYILLFLILFSGVFSIVNFKHYPKLNYGLILLSILPLLILSFFLITKKVKNKSMQLVKLFNNKAFLKEVKICIVISSILLFSLVSTDITIINRTDSPYPWENLYVTSEEEAVIDYFHNVEINGYIFITEKTIETRIGSIGDLPTFNGKISSGRILWHEFIEPEEVYNLTGFSSNSMSISKIFFVLNYQGANPSSYLENQIRELNMTQEEAQEIFVTLNVEYVVSPKFLYQKRTYNLTSTLEICYTPVFETENLFVWKMF